ncbi:DUF6514 family protein [Clostridium sp. JN-9]|uniref:DUF6514 family protein n=1 Tax=Clostridium sp. JN-9 TaxID=2507159 RepID=UPI000FFE0D63|nr:DUF6514 family protein [Clostridium sp. JN-9]QAT41270.1 hypothetical protein EQM05_13890 [Clostridium sp. JN-9]
MIVESMVKSETIGGRIYEYYYRMLKNNVSLSYGNDTMEVQSYGIEVERHNIVNGAVREVSVDSIKSISPYRFKVHNLLKLLYDNEVSPVHLIEVLGEYIDKYVIDFDEKLESAAN